MVAREPQNVSALAGAGYRLAATPGTRAALAAVGYDARPVAKLGEAPDVTIGEVPILDMIASGEVPETLQGKRLVTLDMGALVAGTMSIIRSAVMIDIVHRVDPQARFFYVDTELLFPETYATRDALAEQYRRELFDRIQSGEVGDLTLLRAYRMAVTKAIMGAWGERARRFGVAGIGILALVGLAAGVIG